jgi:hypothetical protein
MTTQKEIRDRYKLLHENRKLKADLDAMQDLVNRINENVEQRTKLIAKLVVIAIRVKKSNKQVHE